MKENDTEELSTSMFLNVITCSFLVIFPKLFREELLGFPLQGRHVSEEKTLQKDMVTI